MPTPELIDDALIYIAVGLVLALATMRMRRDLRGGTVQVTIVMIVGLLGLIALPHLGAILTDASLAVLLREVFLVLVALGFARIAISFVFLALLEKAAVPRILGDVLMALVLIAYALYRMKVVGVNLTGIITTSAIITGAIALTLRETLGNLWGGIALQLDNTCRIGDWIRVENVMGQIVGIRWRYLSVATNDGETVMIPNSQMIGNRVNVLARRGDARISWRRHVEFPVAYSVPPSRVIAVTDAAIARAEIAYVAKDPPPSCICVKFDSNGVLYAMRYWLTYLLEDELTDSLVRIHVHAALARHGMEIPYPHMIMMQREPPGGEADAARNERARLGVLERLELFAAFTDGERRALAAELTSCPFVDHDVISRQGEEADSLYILAHGRVNIFGAQDSRGVRPLLARLEAPNYFGEMGLLTGQPRTATVIADADVLCYRLDKAGFDTILQARPALTESLSQVVAARQAANDATLQSLDAESRARQAVGRAADLVRRIRGFFGLTQ